MFLPSAVVAFAVPFLASFVAAQDTLNFLTLDFNPDIIDLTTRSQFLPFSELVPRSISNPVIRSMVQRSIQHLQHSLWSRNERKHLQWCEYALALAAAIVIPLQLLTTS